MPSTLNSTRVTPTLSEASAAMFTRPEATEPLAGEVIETVGFVVSDPVVVAEEHDAVPRLQGDRRDEAAVVDGGSLGALDLAEGTAEADGVGDGVGVHERGAAGVVAAPHVGADRVRGAGRLAEVAACRAMSPGSASRLVAELVEPEQAVGAAARSWRAGRRRSRRPRAWCRGRSA